MKRLLAVLLLLATLMLVVSPAVADWPNVVAKWDQLSAGVDSVGAASWIDDVNGAAMTADDFLCTSTRPVTDIRFAGGAVWDNVWGNEYIQQFRITFWTDVLATANDASHPGELLYDRLVNPALMTDPLKRGWQDMLDGTFKINLHEEDWFWQKGTELNPLVYWIGIQGVMAVDGYEDRFYWTFKDRNLPTWGDDAAFESAEFQVQPWSNWGWLSLDPAANPAVDLYDGPFPTDGSFVKSADMSFSVSTVPEPGTLVLLGCGGLVALLLWRRRK